MVLLLCRQRLMSRSPKVDLLPRVELLLYLMAHTLLPTEICCRTYVDSSLKETQRGSSPRQLYTSDDKMPFEKLLCL